MKPKTTFLTLLTLSLLPLQADISDIKLTTGYRKDNFQEWLHLKHKPEGLIGKEQIKGNKISSYQVGGKARLCIGGIASRAEIYFGWVNSGHYNTSTFKPDSIEPPSRAGSIRKGRTRDENIGVAYFFMNNTFCQIGPSTGYAKSYQELSVRTSPPDDNISHRAHVNLTNDWQGPWIGFDAACQISCLSFKGGYEYHFAHWNAEAKMPRAANGERFIAKASSKQARGRVYYVESCWNFCHCFTIGGEIKWQQWSAKKTHHSKTKRLIDTWIRGKGNKTIAKWDSLLVTVDLGYSF